MSRLGGMIGSADCEGFGLRIFGFRRHQGFENCKMNWKSQEEEGFESLSSSGLRTRYKSRIMWCVLDR